STFPRNTGVEQLASEKTSTFTAELSNVLGSGRQRSSLSVEKSGTYGTTQRKAAAWSKNAKDGARWPGKKTVSEGGKTLRTGRPCASENQSTVSRPFPARAVPASAKPS